MELQQGFYNVYDLINIGERFLWLKFQLELSNHSSKKKNFQQNKNIEKKNLLTFSVHKAKDNEGAAIEKTIGLDTRKEKDKKAKGRKCSNPSSS